MVYYGLFVGDIIVYFDIFFYIFDFNVKCVFVYLCLNILFGFCYLVESMDKVYMVLEIYVGYLYIEVYLIM